MVVAAFAVMASPAVLLAVILVLLELLWRHDLLEISLVVLSHVSKLLIELKQFGCLLLIEIVALHRPLGLHLHEILLVELLVAALLVAALLVAALSLLTFLLAAITLILVVLCKCCRAHHEGSQHCHYNLFHFYFFFSVKLMLLSLSCNCSFDVRQEVWFNLFSEKSHLLKEINKFMVQLLSFLLRLTRHI